MFARDSHNHDEAWMLELLSQTPRDEENYRPRDFRVAVDENTEERVAFGRLRYHRNTDDTEFVEIASVIILDRATREQGCLLLADLAQQAQESGYNRVFAFPVENQDLFKELGFDTITLDEMPDVLQARLSSKEDRFDTDIQPLAAQPKNIDFEEETDDDEITKPSGDEISDEEVESIKDDLDVTDDTTYKYST